MSYFDEKAIENLWDDDEWDSIRKLTYDQLEYISSHSKPIEFYMERAFNLSRTIRHKYIHNLGNAVPIDCGKFTATYSGRMARCEQKNAATASLLTDCGFIMKPIIGQSPKVETQFIGFPFSLFACYIIHSIIQVKIDEFARAEKFYHYPNLTNTEKNSERIRVAIQESERVATVAQRIRGNHVSSLDPDSLRLERDYIETLKDRFFQYGSVKDIEISLPNSFNPLQIINSVEQS